MTDQPPRPRSWIDLAASIAQDATALGGMGMIVFGVSQICGPAAWIVAGVLFVAGAWLHARKG